MGSTRPRTPNADAESVLYFFRYKEMFIYLYYPYQYIPFFYINKTMWLPPFSTCSTHSSLIFRAWRAKRASIVKWIMDLHTGMKVHKKLKLKRDQYLSTYISFWWVSRLGHHRYIKKFFTVNCVLCFVYYYLKAEGAISRLFNASCMLFPLSISEPQVYSLLNSDSHAVSF